MISDVGTPQDELSNVSVTEICCSAMHHNNVNLLPFKATLPIHSPAGAFHDRSTKRLHHHNFDLDIILSIGLSRALSPWCHRETRKVNGFRYIASGILLDYTAGQSLAASGAQTAGDNLKYHYSFFDCNELCYWLSQIFKVFVN